MTLKGPWSQFIYLLFHYLGLTASGKSFFKKKKPEPETSTPIREDQTTSIRDKKPDLDSSDDGKKIGSPAERRAKNKREVSRLWEEVILYLYNNNHKS